MLTKEQLDEIRKNHPRLVHIFDHDEDTGDLLWEAVFRAPTKREFDAYTAKQEQGMGFKGMEQLARSIVVHPSAEAFDSLFDKFPAMHVSLGNNQSFRRMVGMVGSNQKK
jgi:hypothetical protein